MGEPNGSSVLVCASLLECTEVVDMLVKNNAGTRKNNVDGEKLLHLAAYGDSQEIFSACMFEKAGIEARNENGLTPLLVAS